MAVAGAGGKESVALANNSTRCALVLVWSMITAMDYLVSPLVSCMIQHLELKRTYISDFSDVTQPATTNLQINVCIGMGPMAHTSAFHLTVSENKNVAVAGL